MGAGELAPVLGIPDVTALYDPAGGPVPGTGAALRCRADEAEWVNALAARIGLGHDVLSPAECRAKNAACAAKLAALYRHHAPRPGWRAALAPCA